MKGLTKLRLVVSGRPHIFCVTTWYISPYQPKNKKIWAERHEWPEPELHHCRHNMYSGQYFKLKGSPTDQRIVWGSNPTKCLGVPDAKTLKVRVVDCNVKDANQKWALEQQTNQLRWKSSNSTMCLYSKRVKTKLLYETQEKEHRLLFVGKCNDAAAKEQSWVFDKTGITCAKIMVEMFTSAVLSDPVQYSNPAMLQCSLHHKCELELKEKHGHVCDQALPEAGYFVGSSHFSSSFSGIFDNAWRSIGVHFETDDVWAHLWGKGVILNSKTWHFTSNL